MIKNLILDWSGTVVDDLDAVLRGTNHVLEHFGAKPITRDQYRDRCCLPWINFYKQWLSEIPRDEIEKIFWPVMQSEQKQIPCLPHAKELLEFTRTHHLPVFICSTVDPQNFWGQSNRLGISAYLRKAYVGVEDKREIIGTILQENQLDPVETLFVGDMVHDMETAKKGGVLSCAVLTGFDPEAKLAPTKPDYILRDLRELRLILESHHTWMNEHPIITVGALILNDRDECLMIRTKKWRDKWGIPGGKIRRGESAETALVREVLEETNLSLKNIRFAMVQDCIDSDEFYRRAHFILLNYIARSNGSNVQLNDEGQEWRWMKVPDALKLYLNRPTQLLLDYFLSTRNQSVNSEGSNT